MNIKTIAATLLLTGAFFALPQDSLAGKPDRDPSVKDCAFKTMSTRCATELVSAYDLLAYFADNNVDSEGNKIYFLSRNSKKNIGGLQCKISGADIKLAQRNKDDEASFLLQVSLEKIWTLYGQGKLTYGALLTLETSFNNAKYCIDNPAPVIW